MAYVGTDFSCRVGPGFIHPFSPSAIYKHFLTTYYMPALVCSPGDSS